MYASPLLTKGCDAPFVDAFCRVGDDGIPKLIWYNRSESFAGRAGAIKASLKEKLLGEASS